MILGIPGVLLILLGQSGSAAAGEPDRAVLDQIPVGCSSSSTSSQISGAVTVVGTHDRILILAAVGLRDIGGKQPMTRTRCSASLR